MAMARLAFTSMCAGFILSGVMSGCSTAPHARGGEPTALRLPAVRIATFNVSLYRESAGQLARDLAHGEDRQARQLAAILQTVRPDVVLLNEFDYEADGEALRHFADNFLAVSQDGREPIRYAFRYAPPVNTGVTPNTAAQASYDFDNDGVARHSVPAERGNERAAVQAYGNDCFGFGAYPGQYGFAVLSQYPIRTDEVRTWQKFLWRDLPGAAIPPGWYSDAELALFRLSSKTHADVPVELAPGVMFHLLASHPTPPVYDGPEDRNGRRNYDEIRLWAEYLNNADFLYDDSGQRGGLADSARFVIAGDLNADPHDGGSYQAPMRQLLEHPRVNAAFAPKSRGGVEQARRQGGANHTHSGDPALDTSDFGDAPPYGPGNLRVDYVLPSQSGWRVQGGAVFWPEESDADFPLVTATDHRLVYLDLQPMPVNTSGN